MSDNPVDNNTEATEEAFQRHPAMNDAAARQSIYDHLNTSQNRWDYDRILLRKWCVETAMQHTTAAEAMTSQTETIYNWVIAKEATP